MSLPNELFISEALEFEANFCTKQDVEAFVRFVKDGKNPDLETLKKISLALEQITLGKDAEDALGVKKPSHRPLKREQSAKEIQHEISQFRDVHKGAKYQETGLSKRTYYDKRKDYAALLKNEDALEKCAGDVVAAYEFICRELRLSESEKTVLNNFSMRGILEFSQKVKAAGVSDTVRLRDFLLKHSQ